MTSQGSSPYRDLRLAALQTAAVHQQNPLGFRPSQADPQLAFQPKGLRLTRTREPA